MQATVMAAVLAALIVLVECGVAPVWAPGNPGRDDRAARVEERFAINFCYRQHTNQTDVNQCLLRNAPPAPGKSR